jgi:hypothetical protein
MLANRRKRNGQSKNFTGYHLVTVLVDVHEEKLSRINGQWFIRLAARNRMTRLSVIASEAPIRFLAAVIACLETNKARQQGSLVIRTGAFNGCLSLKAVKVAGIQGNGSGAGTCSLEVVSAEGRRIEVRRDFDAETLARLIRTLEEI